MLLNECLQWAAIVGSLAFLAGLDHIGAKLRWELRRRVDRLEEDMRDAW